MKPMTSVGDTYTTKSYGRCIVLKYHNATNVEVMFENTGSVVRVSAGNLRRGLIKDPYAKIICGVGCFGVGKFKARSSKKSLTKEYSVWNSMLIRCYSPYDEGSKRQYGHCSVVDEWHDFQKFAEWCNTQPEFVFEGYEIDKDLLVKGNAVYGPNTCTFLPSHVNAAITLEKHTNSTGYVGVWESASGSFVADITMNGVKHSLGSFKTPEAAFLVYKTVKEAYVRSLADVYVGVISEKARKALKEWSIE